ERLHRAAAGLEALPAGRVSKQVLPLTSKLRLTLSDGAMWPDVVRIIASAPVAPVRPPSGPNFGSTRSRGLKFGVSELETFSERRRWRAWCHCILVRNADKTGRSLIDIAPLRCSPAGRSASR